MKSLAELIAELPADRKAAVLARAEELVAAERSGRSTPESEKAPRQWVLSDFAWFVILFFVVAVPLGLLFGRSDPPQDTCKTRVNSQHLSVCLDGTIDKVKEKIRDR